MLIGPALVCSPLLRLGLLNIVQCNIQSRTHTLLSLLPAELKFDSTVIALTVVCQVHNIADYCLFELPYASAFEP